MSRRSWFRRLEGCSGGMLRFRCPRKARKPASILNLSKSPLEMTQGILSRLRLPFRHIGLFCCTDNTDIIADSSPKIKMQLATRKIFAKFLSPFGLRTCILEETHHDHRRTISFCTRYRRPRIGGHRPSSFCDGRGLGRSASRPGRTAGGGLLCRINSRHISGFSRRFSSGWAAWPRTNPASFFFPSASSSFCRDLVPI